MAEAEKPIEGAAPPYSFLSWDISTTGTLLCDEFFHFTCFYTNLKYEVYVMPHRNLSPLASTRYGIYAHTIGMYRYLRRTQGKIIKTKTEFFALQDLLCWLKTVSNRPIILTTFEHYQFAPFILIQALKRYDMLDQFKELVHGFGHAFSFIRKKCRKSMPSMNLRSLAKVLLNRSNVRAHDSFIRAKLLNEILFHLCNTENTEEVMSILGTEMEPFIKTVHEVEMDLERKKHTVQLQTTLKPIFMPYFKGQKTRRKALSLRKQLIDANFDYNTLDAMWKEKGRDNFKSYMNESLKHMDDKSREDVIAMLILYFESLETKTARKKNISSQEDAQSKGEGSQQKDENSQLNTDGSQPKPEGTQSKSEGLQSKSEGSQSKSEASQSKSEGSQSKSEGSQSKSEGSESKSEAPKPEAEGLQPKIDGLQPKAEGSQSQTEGSQPMTEGPNPTVEISQPKAQGSSDKKEVP